MNDATLPSSWEMTALENVCELVAGNPAPQGHQYFQDGKFCFVRVQDMGRMGDNTYLSETKDKVNNQATSKLRLFPKGSVLFTKSGASTLNNQRAILGKDCYVVSHIAAALPKKGISSEWIYFSLVCVDFADLAHSSVMPSLPLSKVKSISVAIPPSNEQNRIVAKIEELFSELDKGVENLNTARAQLKVYRQAVLKHAFEGKLTAQWREQNKDKLETAATLQQRIQTERAARYQQQLTVWQSAGQNGSKPKIPKPLQLLTDEELAELPLLPEGWIWARFGSVFSDSPKNGIYKSADFYGEGSSIIRIDDFYDGLLSKTSGFKKVKLSESEISSFVANVGDILINRVNSIEYLGKCCEIKGIKETVVFESNIMKIKLADNLVNNFYITSYLASSFGRKRLCANAKHAVNQASINQNDVSLTPVPMTLLSEQTVISELLDVKLSEIDQLEQTITIALQQSNALRQSILKKAFSGTLVAQDANDEPASVLLARIKAEKTTKPVNKRLAKDSI